MAATAAPAARAMAAPTQAFPDQMQAPAPERAPTSMIPSMPRFRTPARSVINSPRQAKRMAVPAATAAASTETMNAGVRTSPITRHPRYAVSSEDVAAEEEEEDGALEHGGYGRRQAERHLDLIPADRKRGQQEGNQHGAEGMQAPQPGHD